MMQPNNQFAYPHVLAMVPDFDEDKAVFRSCPAIMDKDDDKEPVYRSCPATMDDDDRQPVHRSTAATTNGTTAKSTHSARTNLDAHMKHYRSFKKMNSHEKNRFIKKLVRPVKEGLVQGISMEVLPSTNETVAVLSF